ncbi:MAG TPA: hypothetical protein VLU98_03995 [Methanomicrobiales archaeon]|nr:hypothetical protein [Methanomicrobiales archaeon]
MLYRDIWYVIAMKWMIEPAAIALGIIIVIVFVVILGGQIVKVHQASLVTPTPVIPVVTTIEETPTTLSETTPPTPEITTVAPTPTLPETYAVVAKPFEDKEYYKLPYYSTVYDPRLTNLPPVIYQQSYVGRFQSEAVVAKVAKAPFVVDFTLSSSQSPTRSFFYITVRNNATQQLLAQDGFFGPYSIDTQKRLYFSSPGTYHVNMYGGFVTVDLSLRAPA